MKNRNKQNLPRENQAKLGSSPTNFTGKRIIAIAIMGLVISGVLAVTGVFGETRIGLTLKTNKTLEDGLVGHWTFDGPDMVTNVADRSGNGNHGSLQGQTSTSTVQGVLGQALEFDGVDDWVDLANHVSNVEGLSSGTLSAWFKTSASAHASSEDQVIFAINQNTDPTNNNMSLAVGENTGSYADESLGFVVVDGGSVTLRIQVRRGTTFFKDGLWHHVVVSTGGGNNTIYVDGVDQAPYITFQAGDSSTNEFSNISNQDNMSIGVDRRNSSNFGEFTGPIDDVRIYNRALSASEVSRLYQLGATTHQNVTLESGLAEDDGLVGHWTFDGPDMVSNVADRSGNGNNGSLQGQTSTTTVRGVLGQALEFDGDDDEVDVGSGSSLDDLTAGGMTVVAWIKPNTTGEGGTGRIASKRQTTVGGWLFFTDNTSSVGAQTVLSGVADANSRGADNAITLGAWNHVVMTYDDNGDRKIRLYSNGSEISYDTQTAGSATPTSDAVGNMKVGQSADGTNDRNFDGLMDDVRIYNRALSASEVSRLYELGATTHQNVTLKSGLSLDSGLVGHWTFDGPDMVSNVADRSGNGNNGALQGQTSTTTVRGVLGQALDFDGVDVYVDVPSISSINGTTALTVTAWFKSDTFGASNEGIISKYVGDGESNRSWVLLSDTQTNGQGDPRVSVVLSSDGTYQSANAVIGGTTLLEDTWYFGTFTYDASGNTELFLNGVSEGTDSAPPSSLHSSSKSVLLGLQYSESGDAGQDSNSWNGAIDDVRIYNRVLSADEVNRLYELGR